MNNLNYKLQIVMLLNRCILLIIDAISYLFLRNELAMASLLGTFRDPVILIISDVCGKDDAHYSSERCLPPEVRSRSFIVVINGTLISIHFIL